MKNTCIVFPQFGIFISYFIYLFFFVLYLSFGALFNFLAWVMLLRAVTHFIYVSAEWTLVGSRNKINNQKAKDPTTNGRRARFAFLLLKMYFTVISHCFPTPSCNALLFYLIIYMIFFNFPPLNIHTICISRLPACTVIYLFSLWLFCIFNEFKLITFLMWP